MLKRVINFVQKDFISALRNNVIIYSSMFPLLLAAVLSFLLPGFQSMKLTAAVDKSIGEDIIQKFSHYANIELYESREQVQKRVEKPDDVAGFFKQGNKYVVLLEGNENGEAKEIAVILLNGVLSEPSEAEFEHLSLDKTGSDIRGISAALIMLTSILIGGFVAGFNIVDEKETKVVHALAVSPLTLWEFIISHTLICFLSAFFLSIISCFIILGSAANYLLISVSIIFTTGVGVVLAFIVGGFADSLISAIAIVKVIMLFFTGIPIASLFLPQSFTWLFYPFPHYWAFQAYLNIFNVDTATVGFDAANLLSTMLSIAIIAAIIPVLRKRLKLR